MARHDDDDDDDDDEIFNSINAYLRPLVSCRSISAIIRQRKKDI